MRLAETIEQFWYKFGMKSYQLLMKGGELNWFDKGFIELYFM